MAAFDYLVVGAGFFGSVFAREMTDAGCRCLVIDRRHHIGGNCFTREESGIHVHQYGAHIFHTNSRRIWDYVRQFAEFAPYRHRVKARCGGKIYSLPVNLTTLHELWGVTTPEEARAKLDAVREPIAAPSNMEQWALSQVGRELYELFFRGYSRKQWGRNPAELPTSILKRLPIRLTFNDDYFDDLYQGLPIGGYTPMFEKLLNGVEVRLGADFFDQRARFEQLATKIVYTGPLDRFFNYCLGELEYRTLRLEFRRLEIADFQGTAVINYPESHVPFTRSTEHKHLAGAGGSGTIVSYEYPAEWRTGAEPFYPIPDDRNRTLRQRYRDLAAAQRNVIFGGRLAEYMYYDMHQVVGAALSRANSEIEGQKRIVAPKPAILPGSNGGLQ